jgi:hypothetical protein
MVSPAKVTHLRQINDIDRQTDRSARTDNKRVSGAAANCPAPSFPIVIAEWPRNDREIVRIALDRFNGRFTIAVKHVPALANGLAEALRRARTYGLIEAVGKNRTGAERQHRYRQRRG